MGNNRLSTFPEGRPTAPALRGCLAAGAVIFTVTLAMAQGAANPSPNPPPPAEDPGFFGTLGRWFDQQAANIKSGLGNVGSSVQNLGHEAGIAAKTSVDTAKGAADAMVKIPGTRMVSGHEKCALAPNGAPDCLAAAIAICKAKGFETGKSMDMTTAEVCPAQVYLSGRNSGPGCHTETFLSRALCQ
jgi:hypothetical protein